MSAMTRVEGAILLLAVVGGALALVATTQRLDSSPARLADAAPNADATADATAPSPLAAGPTRARPRPPPSDATPGGSGAGRVATVEGRLLDLDGRPLVGATVRPAEASLPVATTDAEGRFALDVATDAVSAVTVSQAGFADATLSLAALARGVRVPATEEWAIRGTVRERGSDVAIERILVYARPAESPTSAYPAVARWLEDGTFRVVVPGAGRYVLDVGPRYLDGAPGPLDEYTPTRTDEVSAGTLDVRVELERGLSIEGEILDDEGNRSTRPLRIDAVRRTPSGDPDFTARRNVPSTDGRLLVPGLLAGRYDVWIRVGDAPDATPASSISATCVRDIAAGTRGLVVRLTRGYVLSGRIVDDAGPVLGKGSIFARREGEEGRNFVVRGDVPGDGTFRVGPLDDAFRYEVVAVDFAGHRRAASTGVAPRDPGGLVLVLARGRAIRGRVASADGSPVPAGVPVSFLPEAPDAPRGDATRFGVTNPDGTFEVDGLAEGSFIGEAGGGRSAYLGVVHKGIAAGAVDIVLKVAPGVDLSGTLVDRDGEPLATTSLQADDGARMAAMRPYAQVGGDGKFLLRGLRAGPVRLSAFIGGRMIPVGEATAPARDVRLVVDPK